jgi:hypothetical protein
MMEDHCAAHWLAGLYMAIKLLMLKPASMVPG